MRWQILAERLEREPETEMLGKLAAGMHAIEERAEHPGYLDADDVFDAFEREVERAP